MLEGLAISIQRSRRRTLAIAVYRDRTVKVLAPLRCAESKIQALLKEKLPWIKKQITAIDARGPVKPKRALVTGDPFLLEGQTYSLEVIEHTTPKRSKVEICLGKIRVTVGQSKLARPEVIRRALTRWYQDLAWQKLVQRANAFEREMGVVLEGLKIKNYRTRWGTCKPSRGRLGGQLSFSWRLIMAPPRVLDYVVVHELAHIYEANHSPSFWKIVAAVMPDYKTHAKWLKEVDYTGDLDF